jgi:hypothetical protein
MTSEYQSNSINWQISQFRQKVGEWVEWQIAQMRENLETNFDDTWFNWLGNLLNVAILEKIGWFLFWLILGLLLLGILRLIIPYVKNSLRELTPSPKITQIKQDKATPSQWLKRSQQHLSRYNYHDACLCLYQGMLQLLDEQKLITQQESRTDGEYWRLIEGFANPQPYQTLLTTHQSLCFGNVKASQKTWENCHRAYQEIIDILPKG